MARKKTPQDHSKPAPGQRNREALDAACAEHDERPTRVAVKFEQAPDGQIKLGSVHNDEVAHEKRLQNALGTTSPSFMTDTLNKVECAVRVSQAPAAQAEMGLNSALAMIEAIGPQDELEAALAAQMASCHVAAMDMLARLHHASHVEHFQLFGNLATKMQRTFTAQVEALARLRGKGQQTVRVEHVTVEPGGQAIVGDVHHYPQGGRRGRKPIFEDQPYETGETAPSAQERQALPSPNETGDRVSISSDAERPMPVARRAVARRATGKPERIQTRSLER